MKYSEIIPVILGIWWFYDISALHIVKLSKLSLH